MTLTALPLVRSFSSLKIKSPIDISFRSISYEVNVEDQSNPSFLPCFHTTKKKQILKNLTGVFKAGKLTAIMGASGSGKTTLLNLIACRLPNQLQSGIINANGKPYDFELFGSFANYVMQQDILMQTLTVRQTLQFAADLKLDATDSEKQLAIILLAENFKLNKCLDVLVGGPLIKGISGGQRKRTSIAFELISNPSVIVLDEPTSGLDSLTSFIIVNYLKILTMEENKTILMTIHQPNSDIYSLFDMLIIMADGYFIYQGPACSAQDYFKTHLGINSQKYLNPVDDFMRVVGSLNESAQPRLQSFLTAYESQITPLVQEVLKQQNVQKIQIRKVQISFCSSLKALVYRDFLNVLRNPLLMALRIIETILISLYTGGIYYQFTGDYIQENNWRALTGFCFFQSLAIPITSLAAVAINFPMQRGVFLKEEGSRLYSTFAYFLSRNIIELPYAIIFPLFQTLIIYWYVNLSSTATQFFQYYFTSYLLTLNGVALGLMVGSFATDAKSVSLIAMLVFLPLFLFSGYYKNTGNLSSWIGWVQYISPFKYGYAAFLQNQVQFADSRIEQVNFDCNFWMSISLLIALGIVFRLISFFFFWLLRSKLE